MKTARGLSPSLLIILAALVSTVAKLYCAATTTGTNDAVVFGVFAATIQQVGVTAMYPFTSLFNHTPLTGELICAAISISQLTESSFFFWLRFPGIVADFGCVLAILWIRARTGRPPWWACALFALSPVSFMVSGYHGNVDSLLVFFSLAAACCCLAAKPAWSGVFLGIACNIKIAPLVLTPIFLLFWHHRGGGRRFVLAFAAALLLGWGPALLATPAAFARNVLNYGGYWGEWGLTFALHETGLAAFQSAGFTDLSPAQYAIAALLKTAIVGGITWLAWSRRACEPTGLFSTVALGWVLFFVLAPGVGPQYLVWFAPFLLLHSPRGYLAVTAASTVFLAVFYTVISHGIPWNFGKSTVELSTTLRPWALLPWLALAALLAGSMRKGLPASPARVPQPESAA